MTYLVEDTALPDRDTPPSILGYATPGYCALLVDRTEPTIRDWARRGRVRHTTLDGQLYVHTGDCLTEDTRARRRRVLRPGTESAYITADAEHARKQAAADPEPPDPRL